MLKTSCSPVDNYTALQQIQQLVRVIRMNNSICVNTKNTCKNLVQRQQCSSDHLKWQHPTEVVIEATPITGSPTPLHVQRLLTRTSDK